MSASPARARLSGAIFELGAEMPRLTAPSTITRLILAVVAQAQVVAELEARISTLEAERIPVKVSVADS